MFVCVWVYIHVSTGIHGGHAVFPIAGAGVIGRFGLNAGNQTGIPEKAASVLNCRVIKPTTQKTIKIWRNGSTVKTPAAPAVVDFHS